MNNQEATLQNFHTKIVSPLLNVKVNILFFIKTFISNILRDYK